MPELEKPGGLSYEFVLEEARTRRCETPNMKSPATPTPTAKDIERKLKVLISFSPKMVVPHTIFILYVKSYTLIQM